MLVPDRDEFLPSVIAQNSGNIQINKHANELNLRDLYLGPSSTMNMDKSIYRLDVNVSTSLYLDKNSHLNFHNIGKTVTVNAQQNVQDLTLGHLTFDENLQILGINVRILGNITDQEENKDTTICQVQANDTVTLEN
jgi:hypothetical protein